MVEEGDIIGKYVARAEVSMIERFDEALGVGPNHVGSRSEAIGDAMAMLTTIEDALDDLDYEFASETSKRHFINQCIITQSHRDAELEAEREDRRGRE